MKKRERPKKIDNVIFLPGIEKRLTDKGLESLHNKRFREAIHYLEEAREHDPENDDILVGLVLAYFEAGAFQKAKVLANDMLLKGIGDYYQMVDLYLTVLVQLHEYNEIALTIEALLEEREIPPEKQDHFLTLLQFSRRMAENSKVEKEFEEEEPESKTLNLFALKDLNEQMLTISNLAEKNIRPYINEIKDYLASEEGHPFLKTMLLSLLKEQEYDKEVMVKKFNLEVTVVPTEMEDFKMQQRLLEIEKLLEDRVESSDPVLFENIKGILERTFFISYPADLDPQASEAWAAAYHLLAQEYFGIEPDLDFFSEEYQASSENIEQALAKIKELEEISYPNI
ncbi:MAG: tetratricopeptide repeat protein [Neobacillus sp.]